MNARQASPFPWLPAPSIGSLIPHADPTGHEPVFVSNDHDLAAQADSAVVADFTTLLAAHQGMTPGAVFKEVARIAALGVAFVALLGLEAFL